jgi:hypothetical protein
VEGRSSEAITIIPHQADDLVQQQPSIATHTPVPEMTDMVDPAVPDPAFLAQGTSAQTVPFCVGVQGSMGQEFLVPSKTAAQTDSNFITTEKSSDKTDHTEPDADPTMNRDAEGQQIVDHVVTESNNVETQPDSSILPAENSIDKVLVHTEPGANTALISCQPSSQDQQEIASSCTSIAAMDTQSDPADATLDPLLSFKHKVIKMLPEALLPLPTSQTLTHAAETLEEHGRGEKHKQATRCSPKIKRNIKKHKPAVKLAQEVLAKKWGILDVDKEMEELTLQQYIDLYRRSLSQHAIAAVRKLTEVAEMKEEEEAGNQEANRAPVWADYSVTSVMMFKLSRPYPHG